MITWALHILHFPMAIPWYFYCLAFAVGSVVGLSELAGRYTWPLRHILFSTGGSTYLAINGAVAVLAYFAATEWNLHFGLEGKAEFWRVLVVGVLSMAVLRSSFANVKLKERDFAIDFASLIRVFKTRAEKSLDQDVFEKHIDQVNPVLQGMSYAATRDYLLVVSRNALQSTSAHENDLLTSEVGKIDHLEVNDATKMQLLSLILVRRTSIKLFVRLAKEAKAKFALENESAIRLAQERLGRITAAKNLL